MTKLAGVNLRRAQTRVLAKLADATQKTKTAGSSEPVQFRLNFLKSLLLFEFAVTIKILSITLSCWFFFEGGGDGKLSKIK